MKKLLRYSLTLVFALVASVSFAATKLEPGSCVLGDYKSPGFKRLGHFLTPDCKSGGTPDGGLSVFA